MPDGTVLLRKSALGDLVLLGAVSGSVEPPVTVVTSPAYVGLAKQLPGVENVIPWTRELAGSDLPAGRIVDLQGSWRSRALCRGRSNSRIHKHSIRRRARLWFRAIAPRPDVATLYAEACGVAPAPPPWITGSSVRDTLAVIPGAAWATKRWEANRFMAVGRAWSGPVVVLGGPGEEDLVSRVSKGIPGASAVAERGFARTLEVLKRTQIAVAGDSGLAHLAGACGAQVIGLFGPTHPDDGFFVYPGRVVQRALRCRPCTLHRQPVCPKGHHRCMDLDVEAVLEAIACVG